MKKIMFNDKFGLTEAVLQGRKTQTRRIIPQGEIDKISKFQEDYYNSTLDTLVDKDLIETYFLNNKERMPYKVGEVVAIAQSYETIYHKFGIETMDMLLVGIKHSKGWTNKMFVRSDLMPYRICITDERVERLQDISNEDCIKEGIFNLPQDDIIAPSIKPFAFYDNKKRRYCDFDTPREAYADLIDKISGKDTWKNNPFVLAYQFEIVK